MTDALVEVADLRFRYPGESRYAVDGVSFDVRAGEIVGLLGPNGAGKSTTQTILTGQLTGFTGNVSVLQRAIGAWGAELYEHVGVGFELPAYLPKLSAQENLTTFAGLHRRKTRTVDEALTLVGLAEVAHQRVATFSKGMKMRLNLARAMLHRPDVLFLDEPTSGLDPANATKVHEVIRGEAEDGRAVLLTTHDMTTVEQLCDRVAFVLDGRIATIDTPRALRLAYGAPRVVVEHRVDGQVRTAEFPLTEPTDPELLSLLRDAAVETVHTREASLRDVFIAVTGGGL